MRIGIDGRLSGSRHAGIGRYVENLLKQLPTQAPDIEWTYFYADEGQLQFAEAFERVKLVRVPIRHYTLAEQLQLPSIISQAHLDLLHVPHFNAPLRLDCPLVITIHDLLWHEFRGSQVTTLPSWLYWPKYLGYRLVSARAVARADAIVVPAETVKKTVTHYYPTAADKITVTKEGVADTFLRRSAAAVKPEKVLVYIGSLYPHKNIKVAVKALKLLPDYKLVIVGARTIFQQEIRDLVMRENVESQVDLAGYLDDEAVSALLQRATALLQPSLSEGFGLTGVEAMAAGVPVIASQIPIFEEVYQSAAAFFDPHSPVALAEVVEKVAQPAERKRMIQLGHQVSQTYRWETMVERTLMVYRQVLAQHA